MLKDIFLFAGFQVGPTFPYFLCSSFFLKTPYYYYLLPLLFHFKLATDIINLKQAFTFDLGPAVCLVVFWFYIPVNSYGHVETVDLQFDLHSIQLKYLDRYA